MIELLLPYLLAIAGFVVAVVVSLFAQHASESARRTFEQKESRIPDFLRYTDLRSEIDELELRLAERREEASRAEALIAEADTKKEWLSRNEEAIQQAEHARRELERMEGELTSLVEQVGQKTEELRKLKDEERDAEWTCKLYTEQAEVAKKEKEQALGRCEAARSELGQLGQQIDSERKSLTELQGMIASQRIECDRLLADQERLEKTVADLTAQKKDLAQAIKDLEDREGQLRSSVAQLDEKSSALKARISAAGGGGVGSVEDPLDEVKAPVLRKASFADQPSDFDEQTALVKLKQTLRDEGLVFHPRVVEAFHTALKVQNESPLLVLAGISGTGKSLLPQRYAEVLGLHSLMVPVQPRWDSPQDLLGFFNYLEGRYKPTELSRALVQFDRYATLLPEGAEQLNDRLLLVLLDEMNLARVEYYFSEFLSRLEARRGLREDDAERRKRASVTIEVGAAGGTTTEHRVFVGHNVLFVGTINEDESTQTLSDKVVDRANVMRFGRPARLGGTTAEQAIRRTTGATAFLSRETWRSWIEDSPELDAGLRKMAIDHIATLNDALKEVGRPFAYRTRDAILAYLRQYPNRNEKRVKLALADQIEQRVLPKLRGIDPSERDGNNALRQVQDVATQLGDDELARAIEQGKLGGHGHSFLWHGVDRTMSD